MTLNESTVEAAALEWLGELGYAIGHGPHLAPGELSSERESFGTVVLAERLRDAIRRNQSLHSARGPGRCAAQSAACATPSLVGTNRLFHTLRRYGSPGEDLHNDGTRATLRRTSLSKLRSAGLGALLVN